MSVRTAELFFFHSCVNLAPSGRFGPVWKDLKFLKEKKKGTTCVFSFPYSVVDKQQFFQGTVSDSSKILSLFFSNCEKKENVGLVLHITFMLQQHQPARTDCAGSLACATQREVEGLGRPPSVFGDRSLYQSSSPLVDILLHNQKVKFRDLPPCFSRRSSTVLPVFCYAHPSAQGTESYWIQPGCSRPGLGKTQGMETAQPLGAGGPAGSAAGKGQPKLSKNSFSRRKGEQALRKAYNLIVTVCTGSSKMKQRISSQDVRTIGAFKNKFSSPEV